MILASVIGTVIGFVGGFLFAVFCYPDKQDIIDRIRKDRDA